MKILNIDSLNISNSLNITTSSIKSEHTFFNDQFQMSKLKSMIAQRYNRMVKAKQDEITKRGFCYLPLLKYLWH